MGPRALHPSLHPSPRQRRRWVPKGACRCRSPPCAQAAPGLGPNLGAAWSHGCRSVQRYRARVHWGEFAVLRAIAAYRMQIMSGLYEPRLTSRADQVVHSDCALRRLSCSLILLASLAFASSRPSTSPRRLRSAMVRPALVSGMRAYSACSCCCSLLMVMRRCSSICACAWKSCRSHCHLYQHPS